MVVELSFPGLIAESTGRSARARIGPADRVGSRCPCANLFDLAAISSDFGIFNYNDTNHLTMT